MPISDYIRSIRSRIGHDYLLLPGVTALVFNDGGEVLLNRRTDNGRWAVIGGMVDPGEEPAVACAREVLEETGCRVVVERVSGVYLTPVITYPNGHVAQYVTTAFRCRTQDQPRVNDVESTDVRFFPLHELPADLKPDHVTRIQHAVAGSGAYFTAPALPGGPL
ncbi:MAG TPA: NUDIX domain-containing protein [Tepidisphaeraceae bacterium]|nr:NUDIX domain-containing protein [Tepidisphaeraceae bacterium]